MFCKGGSKGGAVVRALISHQCGPGSNPGVDTICRLSLLLVLSRAPRGFYPGTPVFLSPQFQIPIRSGTHGHVSTSSYELLSAPWVNKLQFTIFFYFVKYVSRQTKKRWGGGERNKAFSLPFRFASSKTKGTLYEKKM